MTALCTPDSSPKSDRCLTISTTIVEILEVARSLSARVHSLEATSTQLAKRYEVLVSDNQPSAQVYSFDNCSPAEAEMGVPLTATEFNNPANNTEVQQQMKEQQKQQYQHPKQQQQKTEAGETAETAVLRSLFLKAKWENDDIHTKGATRYPDWRSDAAPKMTKGDKCE